MAALWPRSNLRLVVGILVHMKTRKQCQSRLVTIRLTERQWFRLQQAAKVYRPNSRNPVRTTVREAVLDSIQAIKEGVIGYGWNEKGGAK